MVLFTLIPIILIGGLIINSLRPKAELRTIKVKARQ